MRWLAWAIPVAAVLHVVEEYTTGFLPWFRRAIPSLAPAMTARWALVINALFLAFCVLVAAAGPALPPWLRLAAPALVGLNGLLHVAMTLARRERSPGVVTGMALYVPLAAWSFLDARRAGELRPRDALLAIFAAAVLHAIAPLSLRAQLAWSRRHRARSEATRAR